jgi:uncharacterized NAD(P)/FAD-binding protein YdhS
VLRPELVAPEDRGSQSGVPGSSVRVAIVGGGASAALCAVHLLASRAHDLTFSVHDASGRLGAGLAYGTTDRRHLLNVRSRHMSAFPDIPSDLVDWARRTGREADAQAFLPRLDYADYLRETLDRLRDGRFEPRVERVHDVTRTERGFEVRASGGVTRADAVVLALGNQRPAPLSIEDAVLPVAPWHLPDPWDLDRLRSLSPQAVVVVVGTGLTAVDVAITLLGDTPDRRLVMVSRNGLLPRAHVDQSSTAWLSPVPDGPISADQLADLVRGQIRAAERQGVGWRPVVDGLRASSQQLWQQLDLVERRRFLSTYARAWEIRRHRMAPGVAARIAEYREQGRLQVLDGGMTGLLDHGSRCEVQLPALPDTLFADAVVNCTGPMTDVSRSTDPLLLALVRRGLVVADDLRLGVACTPDGDVLDGSGRITPGLHVLGPLRKGALWETNAIPEIRDQAAALAQRLPRQLLNVGLSPVPGVGDVRLNGW